MIKVPYPWAIWSLPLIELHHKFEMGNCSYPCSFKVRQRFYWLNVQGKAKNLEGGV